MIASTSFLEDKFCRLCMNVHHLSNIFATKGSNMRLDQKINFCRLSLVQEDDELPQYICEECEDKLNRFYDFKLRCESVEIKLRSLLSNDKINKTKTNVKEEPIENFKDEKNTFYKMDDDMNSDNDSINNFCDVLNETSHNIQPLFDYQNDNKFELIRNNKKQITLNNSLNGDLINQSNDLFINTIKSEAKPIFQCEKCGKTFQTKGVLKKHIVVHENIKPYSCHLCPKKYTRKDYLTIHLKTHKGVKKYICEICSMRFYNNQDLTRHKRIHSDERNYSCQRCDKKFKRSFDIISHMRVHTGHRPFVCKFCPKAYKSYSGLKKHSRHHTHTNELNIKI